MKDGSEKILRIRHKEIKGWDVRNTVDIMKRSEITCWGPKRREQREWDRSNLQRAFFAADEGC